MDFIEIWLDLVGFSSGERRSLVGLVGLGFSCEDPPTDPLILISGHVDLSLIVAKVGLNDSQFGCLVGLVRCGSDLDTPIPNIGTCFGWRGSCKELEAATKLKASMLPLLTK